MIIVLPAFGVAIAAFALWAALRIANGRKPTVRFILLSVGAIGAILGTWAWIVHHQYRKQMEAIEVVERLGGAVICRHDAPMWVQHLQPDDIRPYGIDGWGPKWLRECLPAKTIVDHFDVVEEVHLDNGPGIKFASNLSDRPKSREYPGHVEPTDADLVQVAKFVHLKDLYLRNTQIGDAGINHIRGLRELRLLAVSHTRITDKSMDVIAGFENLEHLRINRTGVTDVGLGKVAQLKQLNYLDTRGTSITESGLKPFRGMAELHLHANDPNFPSIYVE
jgi:hypothetical protein